MPSAAGIKAGKAFILIEARDKTGTVMGKIGARFRNFGASIAKVGLGISALGAAVLTPIIASAKSFASVGDTLDKMAKRTGIAGSQLDALGFAAEQSGTNMADLETSIKRMQRTIVDAERGSSEAVEGLELIGLTVDDLKGKKPDEQFRLMAKGIRQLKGATQQAGVAQMVFGRAGTKILPLIKDDIEALVKEAETLGIVMNQVDIEDAAKLTDAMNRIRRQTKMAWIQIGAAIVPTLLDIQKRISPVIANIIKWIKGNRPLIATIAKVAVMVVAAGASITALGTVLIGVGFAISALATIWTAIGSAIAFVVSPIGLVVAGLVALGVWIFKATDGFKKIRDAAGKAFGPIIDALKRGDMKNAMRLLWSTLRVMWLKGLAFLFDKWVAFRDRFIGSTKPLTDGLSAAWDGIKAAFSATIAFLKSAWDATIKFIGGLFGFITDSAGDEFPKLIDLQFGLAAAMIESVALIQKAWAGFFSFIVSEWKKSQNLFKGIVEGAEVKRLEIKLSNLERRRKGGSKFVTEEDILQTRAELDAAKKVRDFEARKAKRELDAIQDKKNARLSEIEVARKGSREQLADLKRDEELHTKTDTSKALNKLAADLAKAEAEHAADMAAADKARADAAKKRAEESGKLGDGMPGPIAAPALGSFIPGLEKGTLAATRAGIEAEKQSIAPLKEIVELDKKAVKFLGDIKAKLGEGGVLVDAELA